MHRAVAKEEAPLKETNDPARILAAQTAFGEKLRQARADAKHGDVFSPEIQQKFRQLLAPKMKGEAGQDAKKVLKDDAPTRAPVSISRRMIVMTESGIDSRRSATRSAAPTRASSCGVK